MDDTLYLERDYVRSGFRAVATLVHRENDRFSAAEIETLLWSDFISGIRGSAFDKLLELAPEIANRHTVADLVTAYRNHAPTITLLSGITELLDDLTARGVALAVITDGDEASQAAKAVALEVGRFAEPVVLTGRWGREWWKPHPRAYEYVADQLGLAARQLVYVGDNPAKDFEAPVRLGWSAIRLRLPGQLHETVEVREREVREVRSIEELHASLVTLSESHRPRRM